MIYDFIFQQLESYLDESEIDLFKDSINKPYFKACIFNTNKVSLETIKEEFPNVKFEVDKDFKNCLIYSSEHHLSKNPLHFAGAYYLVDPSSIEVVRTIAKKLKPNSLVLDFCAAPGGKTILLSLLRPDITILSNDISMKRCLQLKSNVQRLGLTNVIVTNSDLETYQQELNQIQALDAIILDVPCSGSGMVRKDIDVIKDYSEEKLLNLVTIQQNILNILPNYLSDNGLLAYSTCSFDIREDEENIKYFLRKYPLLKLNELVIEGARQSKEQIGYHLVPPFYKGEGHYLTLLSKSNTNKEDNKYNIFNKNEKVVIKNKSYVFSGLDLQLSKLKVLSYGIVFENEFKDEKSPLNTMVTHISNFKLDYKRIDLSFEEANKYLQGLEITLETKINKEVVIVSYKNCNLGFGKVVDCRLKNYYPKGLRIKS